MTMNLPLRERVAPDWDKEREREEDVKKKKMEERWRGRWMNINKSSGGRKTEKQAVGVGNTRKFDMK